MLSLHKLILFVMGCCCCCCVSLRETHRREFMHSVLCGCHLTLSISLISLKTRYKEAAKLDSVNFTVSYSAITKFPSQPVDSRCSLTLDYHTRLGKFLSYTCWHCQST